MKLPGEASLEFRIRPQEGCEGTGKELWSTLLQTARFKPRGLAGLVYWYAVLPLHGLVFQGMLKGIRREVISSIAERQNAGS